MMWNASRSMDALHVGAEALNENETELLEADAANNFMICGFIIFSRLFTCTSSVRPEPSGFFARRQMEYSMNPRWFNPHGGKPPFVCCLV